MKNQTIKTKNTISKFKYNDWYGQINLYQSNHYDEHLDDWYEGNWVFQVSLLNDGDLVYENEFSTFAEALNLLKAFETTTIPLDEYSKMEHNFSMSVAEKNELKKLLEL